MGNTVAVEALGSELLSEDMKWLLVNNDSMFNESYLAEVHELLVNFAAPDDKQNDQLEDPTSNKQFVSLKARHLLEIFSKSRSETVTLGSMSDLHVGNALKDVPFSSVLESRARLMKRIQLVRAINSVGHVHLV